MSPLFCDVGLDLALVHHIVEGDGLTELLGPQNDGGPALNLLEVAAHLSA